MEIIKDIVIFVVFPLFLWIFTHFSSRIKELEAKSSEIKEEMINADDVAKIMDAMLDKFRLHINEEIMTDDDVTKKLEAMLDKFELKLIKEKLILRNNGNCVVEEKGGLK